MPLTGGASSADETDKVGVEKDSVQIINPHNLRIPQFWPHKIVLWFKLLEAQFASARITSDATRFNITIANLGEKYIEQVEDVVVDPPATGQYEHLKKEIIKRLSESANLRVRKLMESEEIGDRTPSQFFRDLKKLANASIPEEFIVTLWKNRLPTNIQRVLAAAVETSTTALTEMADRIHEIRPEPGRTAVVSWDGELGELREAVEKLRLEVSALAGNRRRAPSRSRRHGQARSQSRRRGRTPDGTAKDTEGLCWYHAKFQNKAAKCVAPCR